MAYQISDRALNKFSELQSSRCSKAVASVIADIPPIGFKLGRTMFVTLAEGVVTSIG